MPWLPFKADQAHALRQLPRGPAPVEASPTASRTARACSVELVPPLVLLFSHNHDRHRLSAAVFMIGYHLFIISTFPLAVPLEWNVLFMYLTAFLFLGYPAQDGYGLGDMGTGLLIVDARRAAVLPGAGQPAARPRLVPALDAAVRGQLGLGDVGVRAGLRAEAQRRASSRPRRCRRTSSRSSRRCWATTSRWPRSLLHMLLGLALDAQPGARAELRHDEPARRGHRHLHAARGGVQLQRHRRLQLRRRAPPRPAPDRGDPEALPVRARRVHRRVGRVRAGVQRPPAVLGHGRRRRRRRARQLGGQRRRARRYRGCRTARSRYGRLAAERYERVSYPPDAGPSAPVRPVPPVPVR